jgi:hypothetical protein
MKSLSITKGAIRSRNAMCRQNIKKQDNLKVFASKKFKGAKQDIAKTR